MHICIYAKHKPYVSVLNPSNTTATSKPFECNRFRDAQDIMLKAIDCLLINICWYEMHCRPWRCCEFSNFDECVKRDHEQNVRCTVVLILQYVICTVRGCEGVKTQNNIFVGFCVRKRSTSNVPVTCTTPEGYNGISGTQ